MKKVLLYLILLVALIIGYLLGAGIILDGIACILAFAFSAIFSFILMEVGK